ncbi:MAG: hypothetical protein KGS72_19580 [Cyanobacteria bacterium REEB67]|nr:hypothetical protein [Cyanobacteria bacterium REEB67]
MSNTVVNAEASGLPSFNLYGELPPGIYRLSVDAFLGYFACRSNRRLRLARSFLRQAATLRSCGCKQLLAGGSFITSKSSPGDFDGAWNNEGVDENKLRRLEPRLLMEGPEDAESLAGESGGALVPWNPSAVGSPGFAEYLRYDDRTGRKKGLMLVEL